MQALFDATDLAGGTGDDEAVFLPGADVIERPRYQHRPLFAHAPLQAEELRREFAHRIRVARAGRLQFGDRQSAFADLAVDVAGADVQEGASKAARLEGLQQVEGAEEIDVERARRIAKGFGDERLPGQMDDRVGYLRPEIDKTARVRQIVGRCGRQKLPRRIG